MTEIQNLISKSLTWRYAVKKFDSTKIISDSDLQILFDSLVLSPSSYGTQPWKFLVIENKNLREKLKSVSWNQSQVVDASHFIVFLYKEKMDKTHIEKYAKRISEVRGVSLDSLDGFKKMLIQDLVEGPRSNTIEVWAQRQAYIAMGFLMEAAALLKIDSCPMEGLEADKYDEILNLKNTGWKTIAAMPLGYRHSDDKYQNIAKVRFQQNDVIEYIK